MASHAGRQFRHGGGVGPTEIGQHDGVAGRGLADSGLAGGPASAYHHQIGKIGIGQGLNGADHGNLRRPAHDEAINGGPRQLLEQLSLGIPGEAHRGPAAQSRLLQSLLSRPGEGQGGPQSGQVPTPQQRIERNLGRPLRTDHTEGGGDQPVDGGPGVGAARVDQRRLIQDDPQPWARQWS